jgi:chemotaxis protein methyltransferase CheR
MNAELASVAELVEAEAGIRIKPPQLTSLAAALGRVSPGMNAERFLAALNESAEPRHLLGQLIDQVAVQETYLMREPSELEAIDWTALLSAAHTRGDQTVNVWVCACASGEEAYSVAMLAVEAFGHDWAPVSILATDISERALRRAREAHYKERSMREVDEARRERFFVERGGRSAVGEQLRSMVRFRPHNLVTDPAPPLGEGPFDVVLCRNVLIYFGPANVEVVVKSLESALRPAGQLILGASDRLTSSARHFADLAARGGRTPQTVVSSPSKQRRRHRPRARREPIGTRASVTGRAAAPPAPRKRTVGDAQASANVGNYAEAVEITGEILAANPLDAEAYFVRGLTELAAGDPGPASESLRRALYIDPTFALAAFQLGRAQDLRGDARAARRAYKQALSALDGDDERHRPLLEQVNAGDIAAACRARLGEGREVGLSRERP